MSNKSWLEVSLEVDGELAEAVAEVLARYAPGGVVVASTAIEAGPDEYGKPVGPMRVCAYLPADQQLEQVRQQVEQSLHYLGMIQPLPAPVFTPIVDQNWMESWKQHYQPVEIGERLLVLPAWIDPPETGRLILKIDPGMAFGTGTHPTTQLSLTLLERYVGPGDTVLDIGCGSGILAVAARKLGAEQAYGVDIDPVAAEISNQTAADNQVLSGIDFKAGSVTDVLAGKFPIKQAPVVVANILTHILVAIFKDGLADLVAPGGVLLLSGILEEREGDILAAVDEHKLTVIERIQLDDWLGLALKAK
ncbi:MAG: 50S ribosomal protein L11 methyltransferase [Chloroflexota bacterium]